MQSLFVYGNKSFKKKQDKRMHNKKYIAWTNFDRFRSILFVYFHEENTSPEIGRYEKSGTAQK